MLVVCQIKAELDKRLGSEVALASAYNLLHRHGWLSKRGKKLPATLAVIRQDWGQGKDIKPMFQDEARFARISDVRRCWAPKPLRPVWQGMLTHEYTYAYGAVDAWLASK